MRSFNTILPFLSILFIAIATAIGSTYGKDSYFFIGSWVLAVVLITTWIYIEKYSLIKILSRKGIKYGASSGLAILLGVVLIMGAAILTSKPRFNKSFDLTNQKINTLSDQSIKIIRKFMNQNQSLELTGFFDNELTKQKFRNLLRLYEAKGLSYKITYIDPHVEPIKAKAKNLSNTNTVIVKRGKQETRITSFTEEKLTNALIRVLKDKTKTIYLTKGHGEGALSSDAENGHSFIKKQLQINRYDIKELLLLEKGEVPADADLLIISGPRYDLKEVEANILEAYLKRGKPLLIAIDAFTPVKVINRFLRNYGINFENDLLILHPDDPRTHLLGQNNALIAKFDDFNTITKDFARNSKVSILASNTRSLKEVPNNPNSMKIRMLAQTSKALVRVNKIETESDLNNIKQNQLQIDRSFPVMALAVGQIGGTKLASSTKKNLGESMGILDALATNGNSSSARELRIIALGSSDFLTNAGAKKGENLDLFINATNYLLRDNDFIAIRAKDPAKTTIRMTSMDSQLNLIFLSYIYPFLFLGFGIIIWLRRRKA